MKNGFCSAIGKQGIGFRKQSCLALYGRISASNIYYLNYYVCVDNTKILMYNKSRKGTVYGYPGNWLFNIAVASRIFRRLYCFHRKNYEKYNDEYKYSNYIFHKQLSPLSSTYVVNGITPPFFKRVERITAKFRFLLTIIIYHSTYLVNLQFLYKVFPFRKQSRSAT